jgi:hypothetical protein
MKRKAIFTVLYLACSLYTWGTLMADLDYENAHNWATLHYTSRDNVGFCSFMALAAPFGVIVSPIITNFNQHGWELWEKPQGKGESK